MRSNTRGTPRAKLVPGVTLTLMIFREEGPQLDEMRTVEAKEVVRGWFRVKNGHCVLTMRGRNCRLSTLQRLIVKGSIFGIQFTA